MFMSLPTLIALHIFPHSFSTLMSFMFISITIWSVTALTTNILFILTCLFLSISMMIVILSSIWSLPISPSLGLVEYTKEKKEERLKGKKGKDVQEYIESIDWFFGSQFLCHRYTHKIRKNIFIKTVCLFAILWNILFVSHLGLHWLLVRYFILTKSNCSRLDHDDY